MALSEPYDRYAHRRLLPPIIIREMPCTPINRKLFRQVARDSSGETSDAQPSDRLMFLYVSSETEREKLVGVASYRLADAKLDQPHDFNSAYFHHLCYLFIRPYYQGHGHGSALLQRVERTMVKSSPRPIRVDSAGPAMMFFKRYGYRTLGEPIECVCPGSRRFSRIYRMEKTVEQDSRRHLNRNSQDTNKTQTKKQYRIYPHPNWLSVSYHCILALLCYGRLQWRCALAGTSHEIWLIIWRFRSFSPVSWALLDESWLWFFFHTSHGIYSNIKGLFHLGCHSRLLNCSNLS